MHDPGDPIEYQAHGHPPPLPSALRRGSPIGRFFKSGRGWSYLPVLVLIFEIPWFLLSCLFLLFLVGDNGPVTPGATRAAELFAAIPLLLGFLLGVIVLVFRRSPKLLDLVILLAGTIACLLLACLTVK